MSEETPQSLDYTIVICTCNPDQRILKRCLLAVASLDRRELRTEVILVDNNSLRPVKDFPMVKEAEMGIPEMKVIFVPEQGVQFARMAAIESARGKHIVYIDYDNEPEADYLQELKKLNTRYTRVAAWGPGQVKVDFIDGIDPSIESYARICFQEKKINEITYDNKPDWQTAYPVGTGLCSFDFVLKDYVAEARKGRFSLPGRKEASTTSGEDTEMILLAVSKGFYAGSSPTLKLNHLISGSRSNIKYIRRLIYGTTSCYHTCLTEVFPEKQSLLPGKVLASSTFSRRALLGFMSCGFGFSPIKTFDLIHWIAMEASPYIAMKKPLPAIVNRILKFLKADS